MRYTASLTAAIAFGLFMLAPKGAYATSIVNTFGPGDTYTTLAGLVVAGPSSSFAADTGQANGFVPVNTYTLDGIRLAAWISSGSPNELDVSLMTDASGLPSGVAMESWVFTGLTQTGSIFSAASVLHPTLAAGSLYWLTASAPGSAEDGWFYEDQSFTNRYAESFHGTWVGFPSNNVAFEIDGTIVSTGTPVPEPATLVLTALGLAAVIRRPRSMNR